MGPSGDEDEAAPMRSRAWAWTMTRAPRSRASGFPVKGSSPRTPAFVRAFAFPEASRRFHTFDSTRGRLRRRPASKTGARTGADSLLTSYYQVIRVGFGLATAEERKSMVADFMHSLSSQNVTELSKIRSWNKVLQEDLTRSALFLLPASWRYLLADQVYEKARLLLLSIILVLLMEENWYFRNV